MRIICFLCFQWKWIKNHYKFSTLIDFDRFVYTLHSSGNQRVWFCMFDALCMARSINGGHQERCQQRKTRVSSYFRHRHCPKVNMKFYYLFRIACRRFLVCPMDALCGSKSQQSRTRAKQFQKEREQRKNRTLGGLYDVRCTCEQFHEQKSVIIRCVAIVSHLARPFTFVLCWKKVE